MSFRVRVGLDFISEGSYLLAESRRPFSFSLGRGNLPQIVEELSAEGTK